MGTEPPMLPGDQQDGQPGATPSSLPPPLYPPPLPHGVSVPPPLPTPRPWGFWATLGWGLLLFLAMIMVQGIAAVVTVSAMGKPIQAVSENNGLMMAISTLLSLPVTYGLALAFTRLRRGMTAGSYLGLNWPKAKTVAFWTIAIIIFWILSDTTTALLGRPIVPEFMVEVHQSAGFWPLLYFALIIAAPLQEEILFRGFLLPGWQQSWLGNWGSVILTACLWAGLHLQYNPYEITIILLDGILLGWVRIKSGSLLLCVFLHSFMNFIASIQLLVYLAYFRGG